MRKQTNSQKIKGISWRSLRRHAREGLLVLAATATILAGQLVVTQPAAAATPVCGNLHFCLWEHQQAEGAKVEYNPVPGNCYTLTSSWWDRASSVWNRTSHLITAYTLQNCGGQPMDVYGTQYIGTLSGSGFNDEIRSFWIY